MADWKKELNDDQRKKARAFQERVLGKTALKNAPNEYYTIGMVVGMNIPISVWDLYDLHTKARVIAHHYLKGMIEVIDTYYKEQDEEKRKLVEGGKHGKK